MSGEVYEDEFVSWFFVLFFIFVYVGEFDELKCVFFGCLKK